MKLTKDDKKILIEWGYLKEDIEQIQRALSSYCTKYTYYHDGIGEKITREKARELLGTVKFLSGIGRSAFHCIASRNINDDNSKMGYIEFDSSNLFKEK